MMAVLPLIENPPWVRQNADKKWEKYIEHKWRVVEPSEVGRDCRVVSQLGGC